MTQSLSNPSVRINDATIAIVPNTFVTNLGGGEINVRAASSGGNSIETVHSANAETKIGKMMFEIYPTPENVRSIREWQNNIGLNTVAAIETLVGGESLSLSLTQVSLINDPDLNMSSDGTIALEFVGAQVVVG